MLLLVSSLLHAEQLPIKTYTIADGLPRDNINRIVRDSRGLLWFCTPEGLARFDGYQFTSYTMQQGLPDRHVNALLEPRRGIYWIATGGGLVRFNPADAPMTKDKSARDGSSAEPMFVVYYPDEGKAARAVNVLTEEQTGAVWCGTGAGLYRIVVNGQSRFQRVEIGLPSQSGDEVEALLVDRNGALWIAARATGFTGGGPTGVMNAIRWRRACRAIS